MLPIAPEISKYKVLNRWSLEGKLKCMTFGDLTVPGGPIGYQWVMVFLEELPDGKLDERMFVTAEYQLQDPQRPPNLMIGLFTEKGHSVRGINNKLYEYDYFCKTAFDIAKPMLEKS